MNNNIIGSNATVMVSSMAKAVKFYTNTLGLELKVKQGSHWAEVSAPGIIIGLHPKSKNQQVVMGDNVSIGLEVKDFDTSVKNLEEKGIICTVQKGSYVYLAYFTDPDKNVLYFFQHKNK